MRNHKKHHWDILVISITLGKPKGNYEKLHFEFLPTLSWPIDYSWSIIIPPQLNPSAQVANTKSIFG